MKKFAVQVHTKFIDKVVRYVELQGKIEAELELLTEEEAKREPAGSGRHEPQALPPPKYV